MMVRRFTVLALSIVALAASPVYGQTPPNINKEHSRLVLVMPGLENAREIYQHWQTGNRALQRYHAALVSRGSPFPRAQVYFTELRRNYYWRAPETLNESWIRNLAPFFENRRIEMRSTTMADAAGAFKLVRFEADKADCVAFVREMKLSTRLVSSTTEIVGRHIHGFYCGKIGESLTNSTVTAVLSGIQAKDPTGNSILALHINAIQFNAIQFATVADEVAGSMSPDR